MPPSPPTPTPEEFPEQTSTPEPSPPNNSPEQPPAPEEPPESSPGEAGLSVLGVLKRIKSGTLRPQSLSIESRRACVEHLSVEGYSLAEIAEVLRVSGRTVARDRRAIQESRAIERDPRLGNQLAGQLMHEAQQCMSRMRRAARDSEATPAVRVEAERACFSVLSEMVQRLQSLGFAPTAAQRIEAQLSCDDVPSYEQIEAELRRLERIGGESQHLLELKDTAARARLAQKVVHQEAERDPAH